MQIKHSRTYRLFSTLLSAVLAISLTVPVEAQTILNLPRPGEMVSATPYFVPATIKGLNIDPNDPLKFDFIIDRGDTDLDDEAFRQESNKLIKYFMASLTVPEDEMWVNLSPYEENRIVPDDFGRTEMGRDLLAQDYLLKQFSSSLMYPEGELGEKFWDRVFQKAQSEFGTTDIPMNTFNKIWIVPEKAFVYEHASGAFVVDTHLKVMLEEDYLALEANQNSAKHGLGDVTKDDIEIISGVSSQIVREVLLPEVEKEINEGEAFAPLRQIYHSVILASWYKTALRNSLLGKIYVNQNKVEGVDLSDNSANQKIYESYVEAFKTGVYDFIKEDYDPVSQTVVPRKYFSGGVELETAQLVQQQAVRADNAMISSGSAKDFASLPEETRVKISDSITSIRAVDRVTVRIDTPQTDRAMTARVTPEWPSTRPVANAELDRKMPDFLRQVDQKLIFISDQLRRKGAISKRNDIDPLITLAKDLVGNNEIYTAVVNETIAQFGNPNEKPSINKWLDFYGMFLMNLSLDYFIERGWFVRFGIASDGKYRVQREKVTAFSKMEDSMGGFGIVEVGEIDGGLAGIRNLDEEFGKSIHPNLILLDPLTGDYFRERLEKIRTFRGLGRYPATNAIFDRILTMDFETYREHARTQIIKEEWNHFSESRWVSAKNKTHERTFNTRFISDHMQAAFPRSERHPFMARVRTVLEKHIAQQRNMTESQIVELWSLIIEAKAAADSIIYAESADELVVSLAHQVGIAWTAPAGYYKLSAKMVLFTIEQALLGAKGMNPRGTDYRQYMQAVESFTSLPNLLESDPSVVLSSIRSEDKAMLASETPEWPSMPVVRDEELDRRMPAILDQLDQKLISLGQKITRTGKISKTEDIDLLLLMFKNAVGDPEIYQQAYDRSVKEYKGITESRNSGDWIDFTKLVLQNLNIDYFAQRGWMLSFKTDEDGSKRILRDRIKAFSRLEDEFGPMLIVQLDETSEELTGSSVLDVSVYGMTLWPNTIALSKFDADDVEALYDGIQLAVTRFEDAPFVQVLNHAAEVNKENRTLLYKKQIFAEEWGHLSEKRAVISKRGTVGEVYKKDEISDRLDAAFPSTDKHPTMAKMRNILRRFVAVLREDLSQEEVVYWFSVITEAKAALASILNAESVEELSINLEKQVMAGWLHPVGDQYYRATRLILFTLEQQLAGSQGLDSDGFRIEEYIDTAINFSDLPILYNQDPQTLFEQLQKIDRILKDEASELVTADTDLQTAWPDTQAEVDEEFTQKLPDALDRLDEKLGDISRRLNEGQTVSRSDDLFYVRDQIKGMVDDLMVFQIAWNRAIEEFGNPYEDQTANKWLAFLQVVLLNLNREDFVEKGWFIYFTKDENGVYRMNRDRIKTYRKMKDEVGPILFVEIDQTNDGFSGISALEGKLGAAFRMSTIVVKVGDSERGFNRQKEIIESPEEGFKGIKTVMNRAVALGIEKYSQLRAKATFKEELSHLSEKRMIARNNQGSLDQGKSKQTLEKYLYAAFPKESRHPAVARMRTVFERYLASAGNPNSAQVDLWKSMFTEAKAGLASIIYADTVDDLTLALAHQADIAFTSEREIYVRAARLVLFSLEQPFIANGLDPRKGNITDYVTSARRFTTLPNMLEKDPNELFDYYQGQNKDRAMIGSEQVFDTENNYGGIDFNPAIGVLNVEREGSGFQFPAANFSPELMNVERFEPVIINITPINNLMFLLGFSDTDNFSPLAASSAQDSVFEVVSK